jgi:hypothetical protein
MVLYGCETYSLILKEEHRLRIFANRVLRRIFRLKINEATGGWIRLRNEELHNLYSSPSIIRMKKSRMRGVGHLTRQGKNWNACRILVGKPEGKRPLGKPRRRWEDTIKMDLNEIGWGGMNWTDLTQDRDQWMVFVITVMNLLVL